MPQRRVSRRLSTPMRSLALSRLSKQHSRIPKNKDDDDENINTASQESEDDENGENRVKNRRNGENQKHQTPVRKKSKSAPSSVLVQKTPKNTGARNESVSVTRSRRSSVARKSYVESSEDEHETKPKRRSKSTKNADEDDDYNSSMSEQDENSSESEESESESSSSENDENDSDVETKMKKRKPLKRKLPGPRRIKKSLLFNNDSDQENDEPTAKKPKTQPEGPLAIFHAAKLLFRRSANPEHLVGRDKERNVVEAFWNDHVAAMKPASLYISGAPGTGKTALVDYIVDNSVLKTNLPIEIIKFNCMAIGTTPKLIFTKLLSDVDEKAAQSNSKECVQELESVLTQVNSKKFYLFVLDEIDQLLTRDQDVLYRIFEWPFLPNSRCALIGIANALDLTNRFLPRLKEKNCEPIFLSFPPFEVEEIANIIRGRLRSLIPLCKETFPDYKEPENGDVPLMQKTSIELCARKVAGVGDLRKALDVCRQSIELAELEFKAALRRQTLGIQDETAGGGGCLNDVSTTQVPKVFFKHVVSVTNNAFGTVNPSVMKIQNLNLQQKLVVVLLSLVDAERRTKKCKHYEVTVQRLHELYTTACSSDANYTITTLTRTEFIDLLVMIENTGLILFGRAPTASTLLTSSGPSTPTARRPSGHTSVTPKASTPRSGTTRTPNAKGGCGGGGVDFNARVTLLASRDEVEKGVETVTVLKDMMENGLPDAVSAKII